MPTSKKEKAATLVRVEVYCKPNTIIFFNFGDLVIAFSPVDGDDRHQMGILDYPPLLAMDTREQWLPFGHFRKIKKIAQSSLSKAEQEEAITAEMQKNFHPDLCHYGL